MTSKLTREERVQSLYGLKIGQVLNPSDIESIKMLARIALAAMDSEPDCNERQLFCSTDTSRMKKVISVSAGSEATPLYRHAQPAPVVPEEATPDSIEILASARRRDHAVFQWDEDQRNAAADSWNAFRAAMLQELKKSAGAGAVCRSSDNAQVLTSINPAPTLVSLPKNAKSLTGNSPVIGIDLASGPDRTVEVHYVVPPGYVVVPKEPTDEMIAAAMNCEDVLFNSDDSFCIQFVNIYEAMLAAAPKEVK